MSHYALVKGGVVQRVIVADQNFVDSHPVEGCEWVETSYNTQGEVHRTGGEPLRKNYAGIGFAYDKDMDAFIPPKPSDDYVLDSDTGLWKPKERN